MNLGSIHKLLLIITIRLGSDDLSKRKAPCTGITQSAQYPTLQYIGRTKE